VGELTYIGSIITEINVNNTDIKARTMAGYRSYYSVLPLLRSKALSKKTKIRMYKIIIDKCCCMLQKHSVQWQIMRKYCIFGKGR